MRKLKIFKWSPPHRKGSPNKNEFENVLKQLLYIFSNFFFLIQSTILPVNNGNNFIQMAASAGHAVTYTIRQISKHIIDGVQLYFTNCFMSIIL